MAEVRGPSGGVCDHLVVMRRMPASRKLSTLIRAHQPVDGPLRRVARALAAQHAAAPRSARIAEQGSRDALRGRWRASFRQIRQIGGDQLGAVELGEMQHLTERFLAGRTRLFRARIDDGRIVDGHGDLLADDIFCLGDGPFCLGDGPRILDCLEFDDRLRWLDGLDDAAFLAMDLDRLGAPRLAGRFINWYTEFAADPAPSSLRHHYLAYRAFVRAKVACIRSAQADPLAAAEAGQLAGMTMRHLRAGAVTLTVIGGLPGTGKSSLAGTLADRLGWTVLNSDRIRKELAGLSPQAPARVPFGTGIYTTSWTERTYNELLRRAAALLELGESVIADASWISPAQRAAAAEVAKKTAADLVQLRCTAPAAVTQRRMNSNNRGASDANAAIAEQMAASQSPWPEAIMIDTSGSGRLGESGEPVQLALEAIRPHGPEHVWQPARSRTFTVDGAEPQRQKGCADGTGTSVLPAERSS